MRITNERVIEIVVIIVLMAFVIMKDYQQHRPVKQDLSASTYLMDYKQSKILYQEMEFERIPEKLLKRRALRFSVKTLS